MDEFLTRMTKYFPKLVESLFETGTMMLLACAAAIVLGLPLGIYLYLTAKRKPLENQLINSILNAFVNIVRSFPFLLLVVALQPVVRKVYGRATGDPIAASFPLMLIAVALYARFVEQSLLELGPEIIETARSMGATTFQLVRYFLIPETKSSLVIGFTTAFVSFLSYSTIMGVVGGGGIGDFAIRYGYQRYETDIMYIAIVVMILLVQIIQWAGFKLAKHFDKRIN
ncbi:methionine ABC transporter permease [Globicatella sanguinis]